MTASAQEIIDGQPASRNEDDAAKNSDADPLPIIASADLISTDLGGAVVALGRSFSVFADPARLDQPNPEEFALEAAAFSNAANVAYDVAASAQEVRTSIFTSPGSTVAQSEIQFEPDGTRLIQSTIFINGAVVVWTANHDSGLDDLVADLSVIVTREGLDAPVFDSSLALRGQGQALTETRRLLVTNEITVDDLVALGVPAASVDLLRGVASAGLMRILILPPQQHTYTYRVRADERFDLTAALDVKLHTVPGGAGVAAVLGRPFEDLADFITRAIPNLDGQALQTSLNKLVDQRDVIQVKTPRLAPAASPVSLCGVFGLESLAAIGFALVLSLRRP